MLCQILAMRLITLTSLCAVVCATPIVVTSTACLAQGAPGTLQFDPANPPQQTSVMRGETLFNIAERTRSPLSALIRVNNLAPPYALSPGQVLQLPPLKVHVVAAGETFTAIARRYSIDARSLAVFNRLPRPVVLTLGQRIILPPTVVDRFTGLEPQDLVDLLTNEIQAGREVTGSVPGQIVRNSEAASPNSPPPPSPPVVTPPPPIAPPPVQVASGGETKSPPPPRVSYGPGEDLDGVPVAPKAPPPPTPPPPPPRLTPAPNGTQMASLLPPPPRPAQPPPQHSTPLPSLPDTPAPNMAGLFRWPINGKVVESFGPKRDMRTFDGIEIEAPAGAPFKAAAAGTVVYVGNQIPGYGWLVLIRHNDGIMSAYAYAQSVSVRENQSVTQGQIIGLVGTTGRAPTPRLHFQIRYNTRPVDPLPRLPHIRATA
jgi:murein DD-endopeptidase MepM/ murein hydrolase activator NlpD